MKHGVPRSRISAGPIRSDFRFGKPTFLSGNPCGAGTVGSWGREAAGAPTRKPNVATGTKNLPYFLLGTLNAKADEATEAAHDRDGETPLPTFFGAESGRVHVHMTAGDDVGREAEWGRGGIAGLRSGMLGSA